ncbi:hypothetical protein OS493_036754 [Desmophyllum pertusum]|uniref:Uncharacterized protein n=1 Tax=Desmophyllum pertusum TaxID=174260 RepID=A0A9W9Z8W9_9CNID|nr:hypothetical protein OS493_036754 [Desmophyllum pertusum]
MEANRDSSNPDNQTDFNASASSKKAYEFDDLLRLVGGFGRYQMMFVRLHVFNGRYLSAFSSWCWCFTVPLRHFNALQPASTAAINNNSLCPVDQCCANCTKYEFNGKFTSAVSEWDLICGRNHLKAFKSSSILSGTSDWFICF